MSLPIAENRINTTTTSSKSGQSASPLIKIRPPNWRQVQPNSHFYAHPPHGKRRSNVARMRRGLSIIFVRIGVPSWLSSSTRRCCQMEASIQGFQGILHKIRCTIQIRGTADPQELLVEEIIVHNWFKQHNTTPWLEKQWKVQGTGVVYGLLTG